ncbi:hypothetical protein BgiMline_023536, partial [Biomphalaria glabrata]
LSAMHPYDIQVFIAKSLCQTVSCSGSTLLYLNHFRSLDMSAQGQGDQVCVQGYLGNSLRTI